MFDPEKFGLEMAEVIRAALAPLQAQVKALEEKLAALPAAEKGEPGKPGENGAKGDSGIGLAGAMIDRDGALQITLTNGEVKNLGRVEGKDGTNGTDGNPGKDGLSLESFDLEYIPESHEVCVKATCAGRAKEIRFPAGGIQHGGYWRADTKAQAGQTWTHGGQTYIAKRATAAEPASSSPDWEVFARRGKDGDNVTRTVKPAHPIKLGA